MFCLESYRKSSTGKIGYYVLRSCFPVEEIELMDKLEKRPLHSRTTL